MILKYTITNTEVVYLLYTSVPTLWLYISSPTATPVNFHDVFAYLGGSIS
jgi:hypothetical protein